MKNKKIIIIGCGDVGKSASTIMAIEKAKECGMDVECIYKDCLHVDGNDNEVIIIDEKSRGITINKKLEEECSNVMYNPARDFNLIKPITRAERRAKRKKKRK